MKVLPYAHLLVLVICSIGFQSIAQTPVRNNEGYLLIDYDGEVLTDRSYDFIGTQSYGFHVAVKDGFWGYLNDNGQAAIPLLYDVAYPFNGSFALVGKAGRYFHINERNQHIDTFDWAKAPLVYKRNFLLCNEENQKVYNTSGDLALRSSNTLLLATQGGIIEWLKEVDSVYQYISPRGNGRLIANSKYSNVDSVIITQQGYLCLVKSVDKRKTYSFYNKYGEQLVEMPAEGIHPNYVRTVWDRFVYWPDNSAYYHEVLYGQEVHYPMRYLSKKGENRKTNFAFQLSDKYKDDEMVMLPNTDKWIQFNGREVTGTRIFDDVIPGDKTYSFVKMDRKWYLFDRREDSLGATSFNYVHPIGINKGRFFASTQNPGSSGEKWAFVNLEEGIVTDEIYGVPLKEFDGYGLFNEPEMYSWDQHLNVVMKDGKQTYIDNNGTVVWTNPAAKGTQAKDFFGVDFKFRSGVYQNLPVKHGYKRNDLTLDLLPTTHGLDVRLVNTSKDPVSVEVQDGNFRARLEYKNPYGNWEVIAALVPSTCGNSYYMRDLPAKKMAVENINLPKGSATMLLRVSMYVGDRRELVSKEVSVKTNAGRMWVSEYRGDFGLTFNSERIR